MKTVRNGRHYAFAQTLEVPKALKLPYSRVGSFVTSAALAVTSIILAQYGFGQVGSTADNTGVQPFQSYLNDKETINLATGGVNVRIPLLHLPGRAGHDLDFAINFNSQSRFSLGLGSGPVICTGDTTPQTCPNGVVPGITQYYLGYGPTPGSNGWTTTMPSIGFSNLQIGTEQSGGTQGGYVGGPVLTGDHGETVTFGLQSQWMTSGSNFSPIASTAADDQGQDVVASSPGDGSLSFYFPDGRRLVAPASAASGGYYSEILDVDRNGNSITYNINNITDTLGRVVSFTYPSSTAGEGALMMSSMLWASSLQYMNSNGKAETITFIYGNSPLAPSATVDQPTFGSSSTAFYCTNVAEQYPQPPSACVTWMGTGQAVTSSPSTAINLSQTSLSAIVLPNGLTYSFQYDAYGDLIKITYPDGGYTRFTYQKTVFGSQMMFGPQSNAISSDRLEVSAKYVCTAAATPPGTTVTPSGNTCPIAEETTTYTPAAASQWEIGNTSNTVVSPDGTKTVHSFFNAAAPPQYGASGFGVHYSSYASQPELSETTTSASGNLLRSVSNTYEADGAHLKSKVTTLDNGNTITENWTYSQVALTGSGYTISAGVIAAGGSDSAVPCSGYCYNAGSSSANDTYATVWNALTHTVTDWNGNVMVTTADTWQPPSFNPANPYIPSQKLSETVYQGATSTVLSQTQYVYDNYTTYPMVASGATQHNNVPGFSFTTANTVRGNLTAVKKWKNSSSSWLTNYVQYDDAGSKIKAIDPKGTITTYSFADSWGNGTCTPTSGAAVAYPTTVTNALGQSTKATYNSCTGTMAASTDANSQTTTYSFDAYDRTIDVLYPETYSGGSTHAETKTCYSDSGNCTGTITPGSCTGSSASSNFVRTCSAVSPSVWRVDEKDFDGIGRTISAKNLSDPFGMMEVDTSYNNMELLYSVSNPYRPSSGGPSGATTYPSYDGLGRKLLEIEQDGQQLSWSYSGTTAWSTDETGRTWEHINDALNRLVEVLEPNSSGADAVATQYAYDSLGNLLRVDQWGGAANSGTGDRVRTFSYDTISELISSNNPEAGLTCYGTLRGTTCTPAYDADGNILQQTDARGIVTTIGYDALNRVIGRNYSDGVTPAACFQYYNAATDTSGFNRAGRLLAEWTQAGSCPGSTSATTSSVPSSAANYRVVNSYDPVGRITNETQCPLAPCSTAYTFPYTYDLAGSVISSTGGVPAGPSLTFNHDASNRLSNVNSSLVGTDGPAILFRADTTTAGVLGAPYGPFGLVNSELAINSSTNVAAIKDIRTYDARGRILTVFDTSATGSGTINGADIPGTPSTGSIDLYFTEQQLTKATSGTGSTVTVAVNGSDDAVTPCPSNTALAPGCLDYGVVFIDVNGTEGWVNYENGISATALAANLSSSLNGASSPLVSSSVNGNVLTLTSLAIGAQTNNYVVQAGSVSITMEDTSSTVVSGPSFILTPSGTPLESEPTTGGHISIVDMTGGTTTASTTIYDSGTITATVGNTTGTVAWNQNSTATSIASALASAIQAESGGTLTANSSGGAISLQSVVVGTGQDLPISISITHDSTDFSSVPLSASSSPGGMTGGTNPIANPSSSGLVYGFEIPLGAAGYAGNGDLLSVNDTVMGKWNYSYDQINRLTAANSTAGVFSGTSLALSYDPWGNRLSQTVAPGSGAPTLPQSSWSTYNTSNRIATNSVAPGGFSYKASGAQGGSGFVTSDGLNEYIYDGDGRVCAVYNTVTTAATGYTYDAEGIRVSKGTISGTFPATLTAANCPASTANALYLVDLAGNQVTELNTSSGSMAWEHTNVFAGGRLLATYDNHGTKGATVAHFHFTDILGTRRVQTDSSGTIEETCTSTPFGDGLFCKQTTDPTADDATEHHFTGKERDAESGLDYFEARYYSSNSGIFISPDWSSSTVPIPYADLNNPQSLNLYAYAQNNPITHEDLTGHACGGQSPLGGCGGWDINDAEPTGPYSAGQTLEQEEQKYVEGLQKQQEQNAQYEASQRAGAAHDAAAAQQQNAGSGGASGGTPFTPVQSGGTTVTGTFDAFHGNRGSQGVTIEATPSGCSNCEWIQGVRASDTNGGKQFIDGHEVMGSAPLYPIGANGHNGLDDQPYRGHAVSWTAVAVFGHTNEKNHTFSAVGAITYGFSISSSGQLTIRGPASASAGQMSGVIRQVSHSSDYSSWSVQ